MRSSLHLGEGHRRTPSRRLPRHYARPAGRICEALHPGRCHMVLATFGTGQVLLSMIYFFFLFIWIMLLVQVTIDLFRSHDLSGFAKVLWLLFIILLPFL